MLRFEHALRDALYKNSFTYVGSMDLTPGKWNRFTSENTGCKNKCCRLIVFPDSSGAFVMCFKRSLKFTWFKKDFKSFTFSEKKTLYNKQEKIKSRLATYTKNATLVAQKEWKKSSEVNYLHPYILKKNITPFGARSYNDKQIIIPIFNDAGEIISNQKIGHQGKKLFVSKAPIKDGFLILNDCISDFILICEGWATGCSLRQALCETTVISFAAFNLENVARILFKKLPGKKIIICADLGDAGEEAANRAALKCNGKIFIPTLHNKEGKDFNDLANHHGIQEIYSQFREFVEKEFA